MRGRLIYTSILLACTLICSSSKAQPGVGCRVAVIDPSLPAVDILLKQIKPKTRIVFLRKTDNPIRSITEILRQCSPVQSLHVFMEGQPGVLMYGDIPITTDSLDKSEGYLEQWRQYFNDDGDLFLYGCEVAKGIRGLDFVKTFATLTGLDVAASDNLTGSYYQGGDWFMEVRSGTIENDIVLDETSKIEYPAILRRPQEHARK